jgi:hypothetical protein
MIRYMLGFMLGILISLGIYYMNDPLGFLILLITFL